MKSESNILTLPKCTNWWWSIDDDDDCLWRSVVVPTDYNWAKYVYMKWIVQPVYTHHACCRQRKVKHIFFSTNKNVPLYVILNVRSLGIPFLNHLHRHIILNACHHHIVLYSFISIYFWGQLVFYHTQFVHLIYIYILYSLDQNEMHISSQFK